MTLRALGETAKFINGAAFRPSDWEANGLPIIRIQNLTGTGEKFNFTNRQVKQELVVEPGDLLVSWSATLDVYRWPGPRGVLNQHIFKVLPQPDVDPDYLFFALKTALAELSSKTHGSTMKHVVRGDFESTQIPVPPLPEQRRIVDLLSRAEGVVRLRREAEKKAAELIPALFLNLFGDPATNPKGWPSDSFGAVGVLDRGRSRNRPRDAKELYGGPYPFIQTGDVSNSGGRIRGYTATYSEAGLAQSRLWKRGTLCITIAANIAKTGILEFDACFPDSVVGFLPGEQVRTDYVQAWLGFLQPTLEANAPQAAQKNINLEILRNLPIPVPPMALQESFERHCSDVISIQSQQSAATAKAQAVFDALLARCFSPDAVNAAGGVA
jgi:type I restriction enzyme S subunit